MEVKEEAIDFPFDFIRSFLFAKDTTGKDGYKAGVEEVKEAAGKTERIPIAKRIVSETA